MVQDLKDGRKSVTLMRERAGGALAPERVGVGFPGARNEARVGGEDRRGGSGSQGPVRGPHSDSLLQYAYCIC